MANSPIIFGGDNYSTILQKAIVNQFGKPIFGELNLIKNPNALRNTGDVTLSGTATLVRNTADPISANGVADFQYNGIGFAATWSCEDVPLFWRESMLTLSFRHKTNNADYEFIVFADGSPIVTLQNNTSTLGAVRETKLNFFCPAFTSSLEFRVFDNANSASGQPLFISDITIEYDKFQVEEISLNSGGNVGANIEYSNALLNTIYGRFGDFPGLNTFQTGTTTRYLMRCKTPMTKKTRLEIYVVDSTIPNAIPIPLSAFTAVQTFCIQGSGTFYGVGIQIVNTTDFKLIFGNGGRVTNAATLGGAGAQFASIVGQGFRLFVRKSNDL